MKEKILSLILGAAILLTAFGCVQNAEAETAVTMADVTGIQAYTDGTLYGTGVVEVAVAYKKGTDLSGITAESYLLEDRGSLSPDFGAIEIARVDVGEDTVTLHILRDSDATAANTLVYTGENAEGVRQRNSYGVYVTGSWYRDMSGAIHYGKGDGAYESNDTGMGYQARACLELRLRHAGEDESAAECLADELGQYNESGKWLKTIDRQFGANGFQNLYDLKIPSTASAATDQTADAYVRGYYYIPENYDPANGIIFTLQGQGISYWRLEDGTDNEGTGILFDTATTSWANTGAIVVNIHDRSSAASAFGDFWSVYDFVADDANVMKYFIDKYEITGSIALQGNSRGTMASAILIKALAGQPYHPMNQNMGAAYEETETLDKTAYDFTVDAYICQNGSFGFGYDDEDWAAVADTNLKVWAFNGEQDTNDIDNIAKYTLLMTAKNGEAWAKENVRLTGLTSNLFWPLGESDHSVTRINGWFFADAAYYGPDLTVQPDGTLSYGTRLNDGDTYTLPCRGGASAKEGHSYTVYEDSFHLWALTNAAS